MNELLNKLKAPMPVKWRVQSFTKNNKAICVPYIDSRDVQERLDESCMWQDEYYQVENKVYCKIGIRVTEEWVWRSDTGTESNIEKEKGQASDAFKRAAVKWGVGRFIYTDLPRKVLPAKIHNPGEKPLKGDVQDHKGNKVWDLTKHISDMLHAEMPDATKPNYDKLREDYTALWLEFTEETNQPQNDQHALHPDKIKDEHLTRGITYFGDELEKIYNSRLKK